jgi:diguanylate cyclase (GGDEF)-like protein
MVGISMSVAWPFRAAVGGCVFAALLTSARSVLWRSARPRRRTKDERAPDDLTASHQMSLLRMVRTSSQVADGRDDPDPPAGENAPAVGSNEDASGSIIGAPQVPAHSHQRRSPRLFTVRGWRLWSLPRGAVVCLLLVEAAAVASTAVFGSRYPISGHQLGYFGATVAMGLVFAEATRGVERMRRWFSNTPHVNMSSVWTLSAALLTTPLLAAATAAILYAHLWLRSWYRVSGVQAFRVVFNVSVVVLSCHAAAAVAVAAPGSALLPTRFVGALFVVLIIITYSAVNSTLAGLALSLLHDQRSLRSLLGSWRENSLEYATLCVGVIVAALLMWRPWLVVLVLLPLYVLHRSVLIRQLEDAITTDEKTGLLNATTWRGLATSAFDRARRHGTTLGLLMADLDHFAQVNEEFGYLVGDEALRAVAEAMRQEIQSYDLCGRFNGEEFVILLPGSQLADAIGVADRICQRIRDLHAGRPAVDSGAAGMRLSVSIGAASYPDAGQRLEEVLVAADNALFAAKDAGRDQVRAVRLRQ